MWIELTARPHAPPLSEQIRAEPQKFENGLVALYGLFPESISKLTMLQSEVQKVPSGPVRLLAQSYLTLARDRQTLLTLKSPAAHDQYLKSLESFVSYRDRQADIARRAKPFHGWASILHIFIGITPEEAVSTIKTLNAAVDSFQM